MSNIDKGNHLKEHEKKINIKKNNNKVKKKKSKIINYIVNSMIIVGILVVSYPFLSQSYYSYLSKQNVEDFNEETKKLTSKEVEERISLAKAYNDSLTNNTVFDPYTKKRLDEGRKSYAKMLEINEKIGHVSIPKIKEDLPIYAGTTEKVLQKGVGHMENTSLPIGGKGTHSVLTAHTGLPNNRLFTDLIKLKIGDTFYITNIKGTIAYKVDQIKVVLPTQFGDLAIDTNKDYVTLLTCTPYMINTHRLLVRGHRIPYNQDKKNKEESKYKFSTLIKIGIVILVLLLLVYLLLRRNKKKKSVK